MPLENFGRNVRFDPDHIVTPADDNAVLACLEHYRGHRIRAAGRLHSWSEAPACEDVFLDLRQLNNVALELREDGTGLARIGAGATIDQVLDYLRPRGYTLPIYGIVGKQAIGGAIATATHGSGTIEPLPLRDGRLRRGVRPRHREAANVRLERRRRASRSEMRARLHRDHLVGHDAGRT